jgi:hypothetical protein
VWYANSGLLTENSPFRSNYVLFAQNVNSCGLFCVVYMTQ